MTELEKFKRRLIRMVARLHVQEKKPEDELWEYLRKQTKCDCKWLWERMRALTLKRLKRLLIADDKQENIAAIARMSLTDWLLFDCILVHENIDLIGTELMAEGRKAEPRPLYELFSLVQAYEVEGKRGEDLARAWTAATVFYNSRGRQCSPMLLQRRWYQLKEATRLKFYNFWFMYRGNLRMLGEALKDKPTRLQSAIAKRFPHVVTRPFLPWETLIEQRLVIMPPEFEIQMKTRSSNLPAPIDGNDPDLVLLEPEIETIDLGVDSDSDNDLREEVEGSKAHKMIADEDVSAAQSITLKQEPMDEDINYVESIDLDTDQLNLDMEMAGIEALENMDIPIRDSVANEDSLNDTDVMGFPEEETRESTESETGKNMENYVPVTIEDSVRSDIDVTSSPSRDASYPSDVVSKTPANIPVTTSDITSELNDGANTLDTEKTTSPVKVLPDAIIKLSEKSEVENNLDLSTEATVLPQISNVFGNVNISEESLHQLGSYMETPHSDNVAAKENVDDEVEEIEEDIIKTEIDVSYEEVFCEKAESNEIGDGTATDCNTVDYECEIKTLEKKTIDNASIDEVISDVTFEDNGIEFIDDGIVEEEEGVHIKNETDLINQDVASNEGNTNGESQSIDLKLIMVPEVYTKKLEHMDILKDKLISHVDDKETIELILNESKPVNNKPIHIKEEQPDTSVSSDDENATHDDLFDRPESDDDIGSDSSDETHGIPEENKVSVSSILFQKPRNRDYTNPLVVCKNPDFNTRLKRLTVGFLSYTRNRFLLRACKPLTIDLCKAFESKLVDNTIYFKQGPAGEVTVKKTIPDTNDNDGQTPPVVPQENLVQATSVPVSKSVPSLMDTMVKQQFLSPPSKESTTLGQTRNEVVLTERNKAIVLPDIDNVRRINRKLLVAEVSPMPLNNSNYTPPVTLTSQSIEKIEPLITEAKSTSKTQGNEISGGTVICSGEVIDGVTNTFVTHKKDQDTCRINKKNKTFKPLPWRPLETRTQVGFWNSAKAKKNQPKNYADDQLVTADTLNKMLRIISLKDPINDIDPKDITKNNKKTKSKRAKELEKKLKGDKNTPEMIRKKPPRKRTKGPLYQSGYGTYCCWIKFKEQKPDTRNPHPCGLVCTCCCRTKVNETDPSIVKVCESIESVVEKSRENFEDKGEQVENNAYDRNITESSNPEDNVIDLDNVEHDTTENRIMEIDGNQTNTKHLNNIESNIVQNDITNNETIEITHDENVIIQNISPKINSVPDATVVVEDSDEPQIHNMLPPFSIKVALHSAPDKGQIKRKRGRPSKNTLQRNSILPTDSLQSNKENNVTKNLSLENNYIAGVSAGNDTVLCNDLNSNADDCILIDSDETQSSEPTTTTPPVKIKVYSAPDNGEIGKRRRGRPCKTISQQHQKVTIQPTPICNRELRSRTRELRSRPNLFSIEKNKEKESDKKIFFLDLASKRPNNPIFLGKNKILLTDVPLPRIKKTFDDVQSSTSNNTAMPLPRGVNLVLSPNGALSCTVDPNVQLTVEEITYLGAIIVDIQKRLGCATNTPLPNLPTLELSPGAVPTVVQNSEVVNLVDEENNAEENSNNAKQVIVSTMIVDNENINSVTPTVENSCLTTESVPSIRETSVPVSDSVDPTLDLSTTTIVNSSINQSSSESTVTTETLESTGIGDTDQITPTVENSKMTESVPEDNTVPVSDSVDPTSDLSTTTTATSSINQLFSESTETLENTGIGDNAQVTPTAENSNLTTESVPSPEENTVPAADSVDPTLDISTTPIANSFVNQPLSESTVPTETVQETNTGHKDQDINKNSNVTKKTMPVEMSKVSIKENSHKEKCNEPETSNKKTILSDLMEMSGIFEEDIAPVPEPTPDIAPEVVSPYLSIPEASNVVTPPPMHVLDTNQSPPKVPELHAITSFIELKYACLHNGNFFKLDLETNILAPINVCIRRKETPKQAPSQFVDLTDEADDTEKVVKAKEIVQDEDSLPTFVVRKSTLSTSPKLSLLRKGAAAKPLKIFKVVHSNPNILQMRKSAACLDLKNNEETTSLLNTEITSITEISDTDMASKTAKRLRKQDFGNKTYEMQYVNFLASDEEKEDYEFEGSFEEPVTCVDSDSSDDEPLAKKVKRKEEAQKEAQEKAVDTVTEASLMNKGNEPETNETPTDVPEVTSENSELPLPMEGVEEPMEGVEESVESPAQVEFLSDHIEEEGEDCILGF